MNSTDVRFDKVIKVLEHLTAAAEDHARRIEALEKNVALLAEAKKREDDICHTARTTNTEHEDNYGRW